MVLKSIDIDWQGTKSKVEYEDDIPFGTMEAIIRNTVDITDVTKPRIDMAAYRIGILMACLRTAPFNRNEVTAVRDVPRSIMNKIMTEVMKSYPLVNSLGDWMTSFMGSEEEINLSSTFMQPAPDSLAGISTPLIDNPPNT